MRRNSARSRQAGWPGLGVPAPAQTRQQYMRVLYAASDCPNVDRRSSGRDGVLYCSHSRSAACPHADTTHNHPRIGGHIRSP